MIMISSKAGQRLARAAKKMEALKNDIEAGEKPSATYLQIVMDEWDAAAGAVADELMADRHHEAEGD